MTTVVFFPFLYNFWMRDDCKKTDKRHYIPMRCPWEDYEIRLRWLWDDCKITESVERLRLNTFYFDCILYILWLWDDSEMIGGWLENDLEKTLRWLRDDSEMTGKSKIV